jgi:hypothetical protein
MTSHFAFRGRVPFPTRNFPLCGEDHENGRKEFVVTTSFTCAHCGAILDTAEGIPTACSACGQNPVAAPPPPTAVVPPTPVPIAMAAPAQVPYSGLEHAATYLAMVRRLRGIAIGDIVSAVIIFLVALSLFNEAGSKPTEAGLYVALGIFECILSVYYLVLGIWMLTAPSAANLMVAAISSFVVGGLFTMLNLFAAAAMIFFGVRLLQMHKRYGNALGVKPDSALVPQANILLNALLKGKWKKDPVLIEFSTADAMIRRTWRGLMQDHLFVLIGFEQRAFGKPIADIYFLPPEGMQIEVTTKEALGSWLKATFFINTQKVTGTIPPECYDRFTAWQRQYALPPAAVPAPPGVPQA